MSRYGTGILAEARRHIGTAERPPKSNRTEFGEWAEARGGLNGVEWCGVFASHCVDIGTEGARAICENVPMRGHNYIPSDGHLDGGCFGLGPTASGCDHAPTIERWARGRHRPTARFVEFDFEPGDVLLIAVPRAGEDRLNQHARHVAVFSHYEDDGATVVSVDGNYGNVVAEVRRDVDCDEILGAVRFE